MVYTKKGKAKRIRRGVVMIELPNESDIVSLDKRAPLEKRTEWERPLLRKLKVGEAEVSGSHGFDGFGHSS